MPNRSQVEDLVFRAIDRVNELLPGQSPIARTATEVLAGAGSKLDSMTMVNLIAAVEDEVAREYGVEVNLLEVRGEDGSDPMETVGSLASYLAAAVRNV